MRGQYILVGQTPVPCDDLLTWARWFEENDRRVRLTQVGPYFVSTVFLGLDHNHFFSGSHKPILFETMVWAPVPEYEKEILDHKWKVDREWLDIQERCSTWLEAEEQHKRVIGGILKEYGFSEIDGLVKDIFEDAEEEKIIMQMKAEMEEK